MKLLYYRVLGFLCLSCLFWPNLSAQLQHHNWYFGDSPVGIRFDTASHIPSLVQTQSNPYGLEGSATASDPQTGNLLFYTDGQRIYDAHHKLLADSLGAHPSSGQAALISAVPCKCNQYYIFSNSTYNGAGITAPGILRSTIVDFGTGKATVEQATRAVPVIDSIAEGNMIIPKPGTDEYWLVGPNTYEGYLLRNTNLM